MKEEKTQAEESLEAFKNRICKLSYDELYDELDAAEKAESEERIAIVEKRIDELEPIEKKKKEIEKEKENFKKALIMSPYSLFLGAFMRLDKSLISCKINISPLMNLSNPSTSPKSCHTFLTQAQSSASL